MKHTDTDKIYKKIGKKAIALIVTGALVISGAVTAAVNFFKGNNNVDVDTSPTVGSQVTDPMAKLLILTEPFDIDDENAVKSRANAIWEISEKKYDVLDYANMIYILAGKKDGIQYPESAKTDAEKFKYLQKEVLLLGSTLDDDLISYVEASSAGVPLKAKLKVVPAAYMFMAGKKVQADGKESLVATEGQKQAVELRKIIFAHKDNIIKNDKEALKTTAEKFYSFYKSVETMEISDSEKFALYKDIEATRILFTGNLTKEKAADIDSVAGIIAVYQNNIFEDAAKGLNINEILEEGNFGKDTTPHTEGFNASDEQLADNLSGAGNDSSSEEKKVVEEGGKKPNNSTGKQEQINEPTTSVEKETFVAPVTEGNIKVPNPDNDSFVADITGSGQYVVEEEGNELVSEVAVENTRSIMKEEFVYSDAEAAELADKAYYKDLYSGIRK